MSSITRCRTGNDWDGRFSALNRSATARASSSMKRSAYVSFATGRGPVASAWRAASVQYAVTETGFAELASVTAPVFEEPPGRSSGVGGEPLPQAVANAGPVVVRDAVP